MWFCLFFCKQKTAYEMRISDWSSDVCSSDLALDRLRRSGLGIDVVADDDRRMPAELHDGRLHMPARHLGESLPDRYRAGERDQTYRGFRTQLPGNFRWNAEHQVQPARSEERRVGKECVSPIRFRWSA